VKDKLTLKEYVSFLPKVSDANTINNESKTFFVTQWWAHWNYRTPLRVPVQLTQ